MCIILGSPAQRPGSPTSIPAPSVSITASPVQSHFYTGLQLNLTCLIRLVLPVGYGVTVSADWTKSGSALTSNSQVSVEEEPVEVEPFVYSTGLVFSSLNMTRDEGQYNCTETVTPIGSPLYNAVTVTATTMVEVESKRRLAIYTVTDEMLYTVLQFHPSSSGC